MPPTTKLVYVIMDSFENNVLSFHMVNSIGTPAYWDQITLTDTSTIAKLKRAKTSLVLEIQVTGFTSGKLVSPVFMRFVTNKHTLDCNITQLSIL